MAAEPNTTTLSRRSILAGLAAFPAVTFVAEATPPKPDPIRALIWEHEKARMRFAPFAELYNRTPIHRRDTLEPMVTFLRDKRDEALENLLKARPQTDMGALRFLMHMGIATGAGDLTADEACRAFAVVDRWLTERIVSA